MVRKLKETEFQGYIKKSKIFYNNDIDEVHKEFLERFVENEDVEEMPVQIFYPTSDYIDIIDEYVSQHPLEFSTVGKNADFLRKNLIEDSGMKAMMIDIYKEQALSKKAFVYVKPIRPLDDSFITFNFEIMPTEECFPVYDALTNELKALTWQRERKVVLQETPDEEITITKTTEFTLETIKTITTDASGRELADFPPVVTENLFSDRTLFADNESLSVIEFNTTGKDVKSNIPSYKLIEPQHQINNINTNIERTIVDHAHPLYVVTKAFRDWTDVDTSPDSIIQCQGDEDFKRLPGNLQLDQINNHLQLKIDKAYNSMGLLSKKQRLELLGTDSSKVAKIGMAKLIAMIQVDLIFTKKSLNKIAKLILLINGFEYLDERIMPPEEVLPFDLEMVLNSWAIGMNLGLLDDTLFWDKYFPELDKIERDRIRGFFKERQDLNQTNTNVDNTAKPNGNKDQASKTKEEQDIETGKGK